MPGPFVKAVTSAILRGSDNWALYYYWERGKWPDAREDTYIESYKASHGQEWGTVVLLSMYMRVGKTARARVRDDVRRSRLGIDC